MIIGKDFWMDTREMCERGVATHVMVEGKNVPAKDYLKNINKNTGDKKKVKKDGTNKSKTTKKTTPKGETTENG